MILTRARARSIGWFALIAICLMLTLALTVRVNAVKSEVRLADRRIAALKAEKAFLETEFETRASQQQLAQLNSLEFGYQAPAAGQYVEGERQLALLGKPRAPDAPQPIRVAAAGLGGNDAGDSALAGLPAMVNPLTGKAMAAEPPADAATHASAPASLGDRLSRISTPAASAHPAAARHE